VNPLARLWRRSCGLPGGHDRRCSRSGVASRCGPRLTCGLPPSGNAVRRCGVAPSRGSDRLADRLGRAYAPFPVVFPPVTARRGSVYRADAAGASVMFSDCPQLAGHDPYAQVVRRSRRRVAWRCRSPSPASSTRRLARPGAGIVRLRASPREGLRAQDRWSAFVYAPARAHQRARGGRSTSCQSLHHGKRHASVARGPCMTRTWTRLPRRAAQRRPLPVRRPQRSRRFHRAGYPLDAFRRGAARIGGSERTSRISISLPGTREIYSSGSNVRPGTSGVSLAHPARTGDGVVFAAANSVQDNWLRRDREPVLPTPRRANATPRLHPGMRLGPQWRAEGAPPSKRPRRRGDARIELNGPGTCLKTPASGSAGRI